MYCTLRLAALRQLPGCFGVILYTTKHGALCTSAGNLTYQNITKIVFCACYSVVFSPSTKLSALHRCTLRRAAPFPISPNPITPPHFPKPSITVHQGCSIPGSMPSLPDSPPGDRALTPTTHMSLDPSSSPDESDTISALVVGAGNRAHVYVKHRQIRVVGVADPVPSKRTTFQGRFGIPTEHVFDSWETAA